MANVVYNRFKQGLMQGDYDLSNGGDTIKVALVTSSYTPDIDSHEDFADITNEVSGDGYTAGGATLANQSVSKDTGDDEAVFDADDVAWEESDFTARRAIIYQDTGTPATSLLIAAIDFGEDKTASGGNFTITWDAEGIINLG
jgi:hypothetical protein